MITWQQALQRLRDGNRRFVAGTPSFEAGDSHTRRRELVTGQNPFAIILGCSDSRVPAELVFDQGLGDLFVIRIAGNIVAPSQIGSVEFAAESFGTPLVVVMGHSHCGAVTATLSEIAQPTAQRSPNLRAIVERIRPALESLMATDLRHEPVALMQEAIRANVRASVNQLRHGSEILERLSADGSLCIVGAEYSLASGEVVFLDAS